MVDAPLVDVADLSEFRGAPFTAVVVGAAADSVRSECGWHVAPSASEVVRLRGGSRVLLLPSLHVTAVASITDGDGNAVTGWDWFENGVVELPSSSFPRVVSVTFTHGYESCPQALLPIIAERASAQASGRIKSEALAGRSVSLEGGYDPVAAGVLARYTLNGGA
jgi:hypothetical protein